MSDLESDIREIKEILAAIKMDLASLQDHLGFGKARPADLIDIRAKAGRMVEKFEKQLERRRHEASRRV